MKRQDGGDPQNLIDRRAALKRGAVLGTALVWTVPTVQTVAMRAAAAGTTVNAECMSHLDLKLNCGGIIHCMKFPGEDIDCGSSSPSSDTQFSGHPTSGAGHSAHCITNLSDCNASAPIPSVSAVSSDGGQTWTVQIPAGCQVVEAWSMGCTGGDCVQACPPGSGPGPCVFSC